MAMADQSVRSTAVSGSGRRGRSRRRPTLVDVPEPLADAIDEPSCCTMVFTSSGRSPATHLA